VQYVFLRAWRGQTQEPPRAAHTLATPLGSPYDYPDWPKPFHTCVTEISICSHFGWHYRCSVAL